jgi:MFS family permease
LFLDLYFSVALSQFCFWIILSFFSRLGWNWIFFFYQIISLISKIWRASEWDFLARFKLAKRGNKRHPDKLLGILKSIKEDLTKRPGWGRLWRITMKIAFFWLEKDKIKLNIMTMITTFLPTMNFFSFLFSYSSRKTSYVFARKIFQAH